MSYTAGPAVAYPVGIWPRGRFGAIDRTQTCASNVWPTADLAIYVPMVIPTRIVVVKLAFMNGTAVSGDFDAGIYDASGVRLVSTGTTAQSGTNTEQIIDVTNTTIGPGLVYFAAVMDNTTGTCLSSIPVAPYALASGVLVEQLGTGAALPATATFATSQTLAFIPQVGALLEATAT